MRRVAGLLLLASLGGALRPALAEDRASGRQLWERFQSAASRQERRVVLEELATRDEKDRLKMLRTWLGRASGDADAVGLLARTLMDAAPESAVRHLRGRLDEPEFVLVRRALLRVLLDGPDSRPLAARDFGRDPLADAVAAALAERLTRDPDRLSVRADARAYLALRGLLALLANPEACGAPDAWTTVGTHLQRLPPLSVPLGRRLVARIRAVLPPLEPGGLDAWPARWLNLLRLEGEIGALGTLLARADPLEARAILQHLATERRPAIVSPLVDALGEVVPHSPTFYRIHALLVDLTAATIPPDAALWRSWVSGHAALLAGGARLPPTATTEAAVSRAIAFLLERQAPDGSFAYDRNEAGGRGGPAGAFGEHTAGATALVLYALSKSGVPKEAGPLRRAKAFLLQRPADPMPRAIGSYNYATSLAVMALVSLGGKSLKHEIGELVITLAGGQMQSGGWTYHLPSGTLGDRSRAIDLSNTQYAVLGLRAAGFVDLPVDRQVWERVLALMRQAEFEETGEWRYWVPGDEQRQGMPAIAAASMLIARSRLDPGLTLEAVLDDAQIVRALRSMARKYGRPLLYDRLDLYTMYSVERVGALYGVYSFNGVPWYETGAKALLARQLEDGGWGREDEVVAWYRSWGRNVDTAYALLFLRRATTPVFSGGLNVPSNPSQPIERVAPRRAVWQEPTPSAPSAPPQEGSEAHGERLRALDEEAAGALRDTLLGAGSAADRLVAARALAVVDPLDVDAHLLAGERLGSRGDWGADPVLAAALPEGRPSDAIVRRVRDGLTRAADDALAEAAAAGRETEAGRAFVALALRLKRAARVRGAPVHGTR